MEETRAEVIKPFSTKLAQLLERLRANVDIPPETMKKPLGDEYFT